jgi:DNA polymerase-3 subunit gamma/tau
LVLLNQILEKGFDGQHFIIGLGEHLRKLMISKDEQTIHLMDTSDNIKAKYREQAPQFDSNFLLDCLDLNNKADLNYRMSNNKRLLIEVSLMQMCAMANASTETGAEKKTLNLKKNEVPQSLLADKQIVESTEINSLEKPNPVPIDTGFIKEETVITKAEAPTASPPPEKTASPDPHVQLEKPIKRKINRGFTKDLGFSLNDTKTEIKPEEDPVAYMLGKEHIANPIDKAQLQNILNEFINSLNNQPSLQSVLRAEKPQLVDGHFIEFKFYNEAQKEDLLKHAEKLLMKLRTSLNNYQIKVKTTILAAKVFKASGPNEKFERMAKQNPNLLKLKEQLNLEIDF